MTENAKKLLAASGLPADVQARIVAIADQSGLDGERQLDGAEVDSQTFNTTENTQGTEGRIGNAPGGGSGFGPNMGLNGTIDEVRIADVARSPGWIAAEFSNQNNPAGFYTGGAEEPL